jgi:uncharacterized protein YodC (DUF2158 family)
MSQLEGVMSATLDIGDVVQLRAGGPWMTINDLDKDRTGHKRVHCTWVDGRKQKFRIYRPSVLEKLNE